MPTKVESIAEALRNQITAGDFGKRGRLPPRTDLAKQFNTSRETVNKAVAQLEAEGLLVAKGSRGTVINQPRIRIPGITARFDLQLQQQGLVPVETNVDEPDIMPAPADIAGDFGIDPGTPLVRRFRRQGTTTTHYRLAENFYSPSLAGNDILEQMKKDERFDVILAIQQAHNKVIVRVHEDVIGRLPTPREQGLLNIGRQTPILEVHRINYAEDDTVVMANRIIFVASFFILSYDYHPSHWKKQ